MPQTSPITAWLAPEKRSPARIAAWHESGVTAVGIQTEDDAAVINLIESLSHPPCRTYFVATFNILAVRIRQGGIVCSHNVLYAWGAFADGQHEALGVWAGGALVDLGHAASMDLQLRGVERIRMIRGAELGIALPVLQKAYPGSRLQPPRVSRHRVPDIPGDDEVLELHRRLLVSILRHGHFLDLNDAFELVSAAIVRSNRNLARTILGFAPRSSCRFPAKTKLEATGIESSLNKSLR